jgi:uncharacterized protein with ATP-grasp and redox domains
LLLVSWLFMVANKICLVCLLPLKIETLDTWTVLQKKAVKYIFATMEIISRYIHTDVFNSICKTFIERYLYVVDERTMFKLLI